MNRSASGAANSNSTDIVVTEVRFEVLDPSISLHADIAISKKKCVLLESRMLLRAGFEPFAQRLMRIGRVQVSPGSQC